MVRRRFGGGYFVLLTPDGNEPTKRVAYRSRFVHLAVGYPGLRYLPDLQEFREKHQDYERVVAAYEPHEHVYETLKNRQGTVVIRGGGIVASRVLQRLFDDREKNQLPTKIIHIFRTYVEAVRLARTRGCAVRAATAGPTRVQLPQVGLGRSARRPRCAA